MRRERRARIDALVRRPRPEGARSVEARRAGFRAPMADMLVPAGIRTRAAALGERPAPLVEPADGSRASRTPLTASTIVGRPSRRCSPASAAATGYAARPVSKLRAIPAAMTADAIGSTEKVGTPSVAVSHPAIVLVPAPGKPRTTTSANDSLAHYLPRALVAGLGPT